MQDEMNSQATSKNTVLSVEKAFRVLQAFTAHEPNLPMSEVARRAKVDNATAFRMLNTLVSLGYAEKIGSTRLFRLTFKCLDLGFSAIAHTDLRTLCQPVLQRLIELDVGAASIGVLDKGGVVYIDRLQKGLTRLAVDIRVGTRVPAFSSAIGRAILAQLPRRRQIEELEREPRHKLTPYSETELDRLLDILNKVQAEGFAVADQESIVGLTAMAAPIRGADERPIAAISIAIVSSAAPIDAFVDRCKTELVDAAETLSKAMQAAGGIVGEVR